MANFPTSVFSPTSKSNGQVVDASHINDLQAEVTAIESGYLNGTAPLKTTALTINGVLFTGALTEAVRATITSSVTISAGISTGMNFLAEDYSVNSSNHSTAANSSRFTPQSTGVFQMAAQLTFSVGAGSTATIVLAQIQDSSNTVLGMTRIGAAVSGVDTVIQVQASKRVDATGTWFKVVANQIAGTTVSVADGWAEMRKLG